MLTREFPTLAPNKIVDAVGAIDRRLNKAIDESLRSRLRQLQGGMATSSSHDEIPGRLRAARCCSSTARSRTPATCSGSSGDAGRPAIPR